MSGKPIKGPRDMEGRSCTDCCCLCFFITFWIGIALIATSVMMTGSIANIVYGTDYMGNRCGAGEYKGKTKVYFPRISQDVFEQTHNLLGSGNPFDVFLYGVCVNECPVPDRSTRVDDYGWGSSPEAKANSWSVDMPTTSMLNRCVPRQRRSTSNLKLCSKPRCWDVHKPCSAASGFGVPSGSWELETEADEAKCHAQISLARSATLEQPGAGPVLTYIFKISNIIEDVYEAVFNNWLKIVTFGVGLSTLVNFGWMVFLYFFAGCAVSIALFLLQALLFVLSLLSFVKAGVGADYVALAINSTEHLLEKAPIGEDVSHITGHASEFLATDMTYGVYFLWAGWIFLVLWVLLEILLCIAKKHITRTVALVTEATKAMRNSKMMVFLPIFISAIQLAVLVFICIVLMYVAVLGSGESYEEQIEDMAKSYSNTVQGLDAFAASKLGAPAGLVTNVANSLPHLSKTDEQIVMSTYLTVGFFWTYFTLSAIGLICISGNVYYFFFVDKDTVPSHAYDTQYDDNQTDWPVIVHLGYTLRFHVGTAAFGALILTAVTALQVATRALFESLRKATFSPEQGVLMKVVEACVQCALWCFKKTVEFVNSYAYVYVFMNNENFCSACKSTFELISKYPLQISINKIVQAMLTLLQSCTTPLICTFFAYYTFNFLPGSATNSADLGMIVVSVAVFFLSYLMTKAFAQVYEQVVQSLTVFVLYDKECFDSRFTTEDLKAAFAKDSEPTPDATKVMV